jgi:hypothetical protein
MEFISEIWKHWWGKVLISLIVFVLLFILFSAAFFKRPIDFWGLKLNMCTDTTTVFVHDTIYINQAKSKTQIYKGKIKNSNQGNNNGIVGDVNAKNLNLGTNNGQIGDNYNGLVKQRHFDKNSLDFFSPKIPSKDIRIEVKVTATDFESTNFAKEIVLKLKEADYKNAIYLGLAESSNERRPCGLGYGLDDKCFWFVIDPCDNVAH